MKTKSPQFELSLATTEQDLIAAQRLRYRVFVNELGGGGQGVDHSSGIETDKFDPHFDHLILFDRARAAEAIDQAVGVYRIMRKEQALDGEGFYSASEYDLSPLTQNGRRLLELGRSCVDPDYRGGSAMFLLWNGLGRYCIEHEIEILFGVASFHGTDPEKLAQPLSYLHHHHLAPKELRVRANSSSFQNMDLVSPDGLNRADAMVEMPALIKAYLRLGGVVGEGAYIDHEFNTIDICLIMDTEKMNQKYRAYYSKDSVF